MAIRIKRDIFSGLLVEETYEPSETGRTVIFRETPKYGTSHVRLYQDSIRPDKPHCSQALGVLPIQAERFNKKLEDLGITGARYSDKDGRLYSYDRHSRAAAFAQRGCFDKDGGAVEQFYANKIGF